MGGTVVGGKFLYITNYSDGTISLYSLGSGGPTFVATSTSGSSGPLCTIIDPNVQRFLFTADYVGGTIGGSEVDPSNGTLITNKLSPYHTAGQPTCVAAVPHRGGNAHGLSTP